MGAGAGAGPQDPVLLAIDGDSLELPQLLDPEERQASPLLRRMGPWPWPRALQADLAAWVLERGAARVLFNVVLSQPSRYGSADDQAFVRRLRPWRNRVVLAAAYGASEQDGIERAQLRRPLAELRRAAVPTAALTALLQSPQGITEAIPGERWRAAQLGDFSPPWPVPLAFLGTEPPTLLPWLPRYIHFRPVAASSAVVPAWRLEEQPDGFWRDRVVLIGVTAPGLGDQMETPFGPRSGSEVQAAALASVLAGTALAPLPEAAAAVLLLLWAGLTLRWLRAAPHALQTAGRAGALAAAALLVAGAAGTVVHLWLPLPALLLVPLLGGGLQGIGQCGARAGSGPTSTRCWPAGSRRPFCATSCAPPGRSAPRWGAAAAAVWCCSPIWWASRP